MLLTAYLLFQLFGALLFWGCLRHALYNEPALRAYRNEPAMIATGAIIALVVLFFPIFGVLGTIYEWSQTPKSQRGWRIW